MQEAYELSTNKAVSSVALQVDYKQLKHKQPNTFQQVFMLCYLLLSMLSLFCVLLFGKTLMLFFAHSPWLSVCMDFSHTRSHTKLHNSTIITFHCETEACSESPDPLLLCPLIVVRRVWATQD